MNNLRVAKMMTPILIFLMAAAMVHTLTQQDPMLSFPWDDCVSMDQIVGTKCDLMYYICDYGDGWFTRTVLCNNCIGDCPPGRVFNNLTETCVWPNTIGCACSHLGEILGTKCDNKFYICKLLNNFDWATDEQLCPSGSLYDPDTITCRTPSDIGC